MHQDAVLTECARSTIHMYSSGSSASGVDRIPHHDGGSSSWAGTSSRDKALAQALNDKGQVVRSTDAVLQAAVEEGIVPGGGVALLYASKTLEEVKSKNASFDQKIGVDIVMKALQMPLKTIANNAGVPACCAVLCSHVAAPH